MGCHAYLTFTWVLVIGTLVLTLGMYKQTTSFHQPKAKNVTTQHLRPVAECPSLLLHTHLMFPTNVFKSILTYDIHYTLNYKNFMKLLPHWEMEFGMT